MCHHWDYEHAYERPGERETGAERERIDADAETDRREDDPLADVPLADD